MQELRPHERERGEYKDATPRKRAGDYDCTGQQDRCPPATHPQASTPRETTAKASGSSHTNPNATAAPTPMDYDCTGQQGTPLATHPQAGTLRGATAKASGSSHTTPNATATPTPMDYDCTGQQEGSRKEAPLATHPQAGTLRGTVGQLDQHQTQGQRPRKPQHRSSPPQNHSCTGQSEAAHQLTGTAPKQPKHSCSPPQNHNCTGWQKRDPRKSRQTARAKAEVRVRDAQADRAMRRAMHRLHGGAWGWRQVPTLKSSR
jgi:hypothetical protein